MSRFDFAFASLFGRHQRLGRVCYVQGDWFSQLAVSVEWWGPKCIFRLPFSPHASNASNLHAARQRNQPKASPRPSQLDQNISRMNQPTTKILIRKIMLTEIRGLPTARDLPRQDDSKTCRPRLEGVLPAWSHIYHLYHRLVRYWTWDHSPSRVTVGLKSMTRILQVTQRYRHTSRLT